MLGADYCVPRIASLQLDKPRDGNSRGGNVALDARTLTNSKPPPWRRGQENPEWARRAIVDVTSSRSDWGFPGFFKFWIGKDLSEISDSDLSTFEDIRWAVELQHRLRNAASDQRFFLRLDGKIFLVEWRKSGAFGVSYAVGEGVSGKLTVGDDQLDTLPRLIEVASRFFRPCGP